MCVCFFVDGDLGLFWACSCFSSHFISGGVLGRSGRDQESADGNPTSEDFASFQLMPRPPSLSASREGACGLAIPAHTHRACRKSGHLGETRPLLPVLLPALQRQRQAVNQGMALSLAATPPLALLLESRLHLSCATRGVSLAACVETCQCPCLDLCNAETRQMSLQLRTLACDMGSCQSQLALTYVVTPKHATHRYPACYPSRDRRQRLLCHQ